MCGICLLLAGRFRAFGFLGAWQKRFADLRADLAADFGWNSAVNGWRHPATSVGFSWT
jgi:hypothetical protein